MWMGAKRRRRRPRESLLASVLLAHCAAVGHAGTPNAWSTVALSGDVPGRLGGHGTAEAGGLVYVFGGHRSGDSGSYYYNNRLTEIDPATGVCTRLDAGAGVTGAPPSAREDMGFAALDGVLWVFGGDDGSSRLRDLHAYTIAARAWRQLDAAAGVSGTPPSARSSMGFSAGAGGLLVTYGSCCPRDAHFFDVAAQAWRALPAPPERGGLVQASSRFGHGQAVLNGTAFVFGGYYVGGYRNDLLTLKLGDAAAQWAAVAAQGDVPAGRAYGALAAVGQQLLLYGGYSGSTYYSDLALLDPRTGSWTAVTGASGTTPAGRESFGGAAVVGCSVFYYGGSTGSYSYSSELIRYEADPAVTQCGETSPPTTTPPPSTTTPSPTTTPSLPSPVTPPPPPPPPPSAPPSRSKDWGKAEYDHCVQALSWADLIQGDKTGTVTFKMGGLGALVEEEGYETWQCIRDHYCAADAADPWFCFVYHETDKVFTPWGHNAQLQLVSPSPCDCQCSCP